MMSIAASSLLLSSLVAPAEAASCDSQLGKVGSLAADATGSAFADLVRCDKKIAEVNFNRYLERATDTDAVVALFTAAVDAEVWNPVWTALGKVTSYEARDEIARRIGESCADRPKVVNFLQGAYFGLRDIEFQQWDDGYEACGAEPLWTWMDTQVEAPPAKLFDEKFNALMGIYVKRKGAGALPSLGTGAVKAAKGGGPFDAMLAKMVEAVTPTMGTTLTPEDQKSLEETMVAVARQVGIEEARRVAGQLANAGADAAAASLLPTLYPDRSQAGGTWLYGAASVEAGDCDGKKTAVIHYASVSEPGKRWSILADVEAPLRASKAKLGKDCTAEPSWAVLTTPEPVKSAGDVETWVKTLEAQWEKDGYAVKSQKEKAVTLP